MDRSYKKADSVRVFKDQATKNANLPETTIQRLGYSRYGWEHYLYRGVMYKGFVDPSGVCDACIILTEPLCLP